MKSKRIFYLVTFILLLLSSGSVMAQWFWQNPLPQGNTLTGVSFTDTNYGITVGYDGTILRTMNGGSTWVSQSSGTDNRLYGVYFYDANNGITVGNIGTILRTTDGGDNWVIQ